MFRVFLIVVGFLIIYSKDAHRLCDLYRIQYPHWSQLSILDPHLWPHLGYPWQHLSTIVMTTTISTIFVNKCWHLGLGIRVHTTSIVMLYCAIRFLQFSIAIAFATTSTTNGKDSLLNSTYVVLTFAIFLSHWTPHLLTWLHATM